MKYNYEILSVDNDGNITRLTATTLKNAKEQVNILKEFKKIFFNEFEIIINRFSLTSEEVIYRKEVRLWKLQL